MSDPTESIRRAMTEKINEHAAERQALEREYGQVWDTQQLQADFNVLAFLAPFVSVRRKSDGVMGTLVFQHYPRFYFRFQEDT